MDRLSFTESFVSKDFEYEAINYFSEMMALYDLVGQYDIEQIQTINDGCNISFDLLFSSEQLAINMESIIACIEITRFEHTYVVKQSRVDNKINIILIDRVSG